MIQGRFKIDTGLAINISKASSFRTSNNRNTTCRFFQTPEKTSKMTGLNRKFIERLHIILCTLCFNWYCMFQSLHKILIYGHSVIKKRNLPIGMLKKKG